MPQFYKCTIKGPNAGIDQQVYTVRHDRDAIVRIARDEIGRRGDSLEWFANVPLTETTEGEFEYERTLEGDEEFRVALEFLRDEPGSVFDIEEI